MTERLLDKFLESDSMKQAELLAMLTPEERHALLVIHAVVILLDVLIYQLLFLVQLLVKYAHTLD